MQSVVVDIDDPTRVEQPALLAAQASANPQARVFLFHNVFHRNIIDRTKAEDQVLKEARELLLRSRKSKLDELGAEHFGDRAESVLVWSEQGWFELLRFAIDRKCDLLVAQTTSRRRWKRLGLTNEDWELIRHCPMPLLLARDESPKEYKWIVAALDPWHANDETGDLDQLILQCAGEFSQHHGAPLSVIHVVEQLFEMSPPPMPMSPMTDSYDDVLAAHQSRIDGIITAAECKVADSSLVVGVPADEIVNFVVAKNADLLVIGAVSRSLLARLLIGNTAERVLDRLPCDFLIVKPAGFTTRLPALGNLKSPPSVLVF